MPVHYGYEVQIDNHPETSNEDDYHITGTLYSLTKPLAKPRQAQDLSGTRWRSLWTVPHTVVVLNGVKVTDYTEGDPVPDRKFDFEPQAWATAPWKVYFWTTESQPTTTLFSSRKLPSKKLNK